MSFTDDASNQESLTSAATGAVTLTLTPLTVSLTVVAPAAHNGSTAFTFEIRFNEEFPLSYRTLRDYTLTITGGEVMKRSAYRRIP